MKFTAVLIAAGASLAAAQTATSAVASTPSCAAQNILDACKASIQGQINSCSQTDYSCLCNQYVNLLTCYNNCPNDAGVSTVQQQRQQFCAAASVYATTSTHAAATASTVATTSSISSVTAQTGFASSTQTSASASTTTKNAAPAALPIVGGGMIGFAAAVLGFLL